MNIDMYYDEGHAAVKAMRLSASALWSIASNRGEDFWIRQGAYIELRTRGYAVPRMLPVEGDPLPQRAPTRLTLVRDET